MTKIEFLLVYKKKKIYIYCISILLLNLINNNNLFIFISYSSYVFLSLYKNINKQRTDINAKICNPNALLTNYKSLKEKNKQTYTCAYTQYANTHSHRCYFNFIYY